MTKMESTQAEAVRERTQWEISAQLPTGSSGLALPTR